MKIRIKDNSIRLRLTQSEVDLLSKEKKVEKETYFSPDNSFTYALEIADITSVQATFIENKMTVILPETIAQTWITTEQVGIERLSPIDTSRSLKILVEKDFTCLVKRVGDDDADAYPHPAQ